MNIAEGLANTAKDLVLDQAKPDLVETLLPELQGIAMELVDGLKDGVGFGTFNKLATIIPKVMKVAESINQPGPDKKAFVQDALWIVYKTVDQGTDGTQNLIDLPWIPSLIEPTIEKAVVRLVAGFCIEALMDPMTRAGDINLEASEPTV